MNSTAPSDDNETVLLRKFYSESAAVAVHAALEEAGIPCFLARGDAAGWAPHFQWVGGVLLFVREDDREEAERILRKLDSA